MPSLVFFALTTVAIVICQPTGVTAVDTQCGAVNQPSHICPATATYADVGCGVRAQAVNLYCSASVSLTEGGVTYPDNLYENCAPSETQTNKCCLAPTEAGGIRLIQFDNSYENSDDPGDLFVLTRFDYVTTGVPIFDVTIRGFQLSSFDLRNYSTNATTCNGTQVQQGSFELYMVANHVSDTFVTTVAATDGLVPIWTSTFELWYASISLTPYKIAHTPKVNQDVYDAGTIFGPEKRPTFIYIPTQAPTRVPTRDPTSAPTAPTTVPTSTPTSTHAVTPTLTPTFRTITPTMSPVALSNTTKDGDVWMWPVVGCGVALCLGLLLCGLKRTYGNKDSDPRMNYMAPFNKQGSANWAEATQNPLEGSPPTIQEIGAQPVRASTSMFGFLLWGDRMRSGRSGKSGRTGADSVSEFSSSQQNVGSGRRYRAGTNKSTGSRETITSYMWSGVFNSIRSKPKTNARHHKQSAHDMSSVELREY